MVGKTPGGTRCAENVSLKNRSPLRSDRPKQACCGSLSEDGQCRVDLLQANYADSDSPKRKTAS